MKIKVDDIELYYEVHGEGEPIIFSHGWMGECPVWNSQIEFFSKKYKVIAYDHRGHGKSDKPKANYSVETLSNDLYSLIRDCRKSSKTKTLKIVTISKSLCLAVSNLDLQWKT